MMDFVYLAGTVAFFAMMLAYVAGCRRLGTPPVESATESRP